MLLLIRLLGFWGLWGFRALGLRVRGFFQGAVKVSLKGAMGGSCTGYFRGAARALQTGWGIFMNPSRPPSSMRLLFSCWGLFNGN